MSVNGIANLVQNISDPSFGQTEETKAGTNASRTENAANAAVVEDVFTPSSQNASAQAVHDAGIFQIAQGTATSAATQIPFAQSTASGNQNGAPELASTVTTTNTGAPQTAAATKTGTPAKAGQQTAGTPATQAANSAAAAANVQLQIQSLNASLPTLGLTNTEINQIDRIASLVQNFNPAAYASLVKQFEALAQQAAPSSGLNAAVIPGTNAAANTESSSNGAGFQVQQILLTFAGAQQTAGDNGAASGDGQALPGNKAQTPAAGLRIEKVQFTLTNGNGRTVQLQAP